MNAVSSGSCVLVQYLFILGPKRKAEQTLGTFLLGQGREDVAILQPPANLCFYCHVLYLMYKKGGKNTSFETYFCLVISTQKKH